VKNTKRPSSLSNLLIQRQHQGS